MNSSRGGFGVIISGLVATTIAGILIFTCLPIRTQHDADSFLEEWNKKESDLDASDHKLMAEPGLPDAREFPPVPMATIAVKDAWRRPRALVQGKVILVKHEDDGDYHFAIEGDGVRIVCEIIPQLPLAHPKVGDRVKVWGIPRWDGQHAWMELHPVIGLKVSP